MLPHQPVCAAGVTILTRHINPVLLGLPIESHVLGVRDKLCVPVAKNGLIPPPGVVDFVRFVDLSCYRITGATVGFPLTLRHLNPLFATSLPPKNVVIYNPQHLCVPVIKNGLPAHNAGITFNRQLCVPIEKAGALIPPDVLNVVRWVDLEMYDIQTAPLAAGVTLQLRHINPILVNLPPEIATFQQAFQLGLPVSKNGLTPPV